MWQKMAIPYKFSVEPKTWPMVSLQSMHECINAINALIPIICQKIRQDHMILLDQIWDILFGRLPVSDSSEEEEERKASSEIFTT